MASSLADSGMLYEGEGNYGSWIGPVGAALDVVDQNGMISGDGETTSKHHLRYDIIRARVSPRLWMRVPEVLHEAHVSSLLEILRKLATPFRLMDLPPEIRLRIYRFALSRESWIMLGCRRAPARTRGLQIIHVSQQVRTEALPLLYQCTLFNFNFGTYRPLSLDSRKGNSRIAPVIRSWAESHGGAKTLHHLRAAQFSVWITPAVRSRGNNLCIIQITYTKQDGLQATFPDNLTENSQSKLREHFETVERDRKCFGLQGEAIVLAMISKPRLWEYRKLDMKIRRMKVSARKIILSLI